MHIYVEIFISREVILEKSESIGRCFLIRSLDGKRWRLTLETITGGLFQVLTEIILGFGGKNVNQKEISIITDTFYIEAMKI